MSVTFDEEQQLARTAQTGVSGLYGLVIRWGFAKDEKSAGVVLGSAAGLLLIIAVSLFVFAPGSRSKISPQEYLHGGYITSPPTP